MCLYIDRRRHHVGAEIVSKPRTLKESMLVYKVVNWGRGKKYFVPSFIRSWDIRYEVGKTYELGYSLRIELDAGAIPTVQDGFHAYTTLEAALAMCVWIRPMGIMLNVGIPAGAHVYFGKFDEIVSDKIVIVGETPRPYPKNVYSAGHR